jgi:hypothetical protein
MDTTQTPPRIQRRRTAGWRAPTGATYVGRGTRFGNPWVISHHGDHWTLNWSGNARYEPANGAYSVRCAYETTARDLAIRYYREHLAAHPGLAQTARQMLAGRTLMCWCRLDQPCHADVLLQIANETGQTRPAA